MLTETQTQALTAAVQGLRAPFSASFWDSLMVVVLRHVFGPAVPPMTPEKSGILLRDARQTLKRPLPDADVVILRQRFLILILEGLGLDVGVATTWTAADVDVALQGTLPQFAPVRCERNERHTQYLEGLVGYYADEAIASIITPHITRWIEQTALNLQQDIRIDLADTSLVQIHLWQMVQDEERKQLLRPEHGEITVPPQQVRQSPLQQEKPPQQGGGGGGGGGKHQ